MTLFRQWSEAMQTEFHQSTIGRPVTVVYSATCYLLFGKTISVMAGEAAEFGYWYGESCCEVINWLLRDPQHCVNELIDYVNTIH